MAWQRARHNTIEAVLVLLSNASCATTCTSFGGVHAMRENSFECVVVRATREKKVESRRYWETQHWSSEKCFSDVARRVFWSAFSANLMWSRTISFDNSLAPNKKSYQRKYQLTVVDEEKHKMLVPPHMIEEQSKIIYQINKYYVERVQSRMTVIDKTIREICQIVQDILREVEVQEPRFISSLSECNGRWEWSSERCLSVGRFNNFQQFQIRRHRRGVAERVRDCLVLESDGSL